MDRSPPPPPFRVAEYGPGFEPSTPGRLVTLAYEENGEERAVGRLRVSAHSLRLQRLDAVPLGSVRPVNEGYAFRTRDGHVLCSLNPSAHKVTCDDRLQWVATPYKDRIIVTDGDGHDRTIELETHRTRIESAGKAWTPHATTLIYHAYAQRAGDIDQFAAYTLLAWSLRSWDDNAIREEQ